MTNSTTKWTASRCNVACNVHESPKNAQQWGGTAMMCGSSPSWWMDNNVIEWQRQHENKVCLSVWTAPLRRNTFGSVVTWGTMPQRWGGRKHSRLILRRAWGENRTVERKWRTILILGWDWNTDANSQFFWSVLPKFEPKNNCGSRHSDHPTVRHPSCKTTDHGPWTSSSLQQAWKSQRQDTQQKGSREQAKTTEENASRLHVHLPCALQFQKWCTLTHSKSTVGAWAPQGNSKKHCSQCPQIVKAPELLGKLQGGMVSGQSLTAEQKWLCKIIDNNKVHTAPKKKNSAENCVWVEFHVVPH